MKGSITVDLAKAQAAVDAHKANPPSGEEVAKDPRAFLASLGIEVDEDALALLQAKMASNPGLADAPKQAAILHVDA